MSIPMLVFFRQTMLRLALAAVLAARPGAAYALTVKPAEVLTVERCEQFLLNPAGTALRAWVLNELGKFDQLMLNAVEEVPDPVAAPEDLPYELFREENFGRPDEEMLAEYTQRVQGIQRARILAKRAGSVAPNPSPRAKADEFLKRANLQKHLSPLAARALGIERPEPVRFVDIQGVSALVLAGRIELRTIGRDGAVIGEVNLPFASLRLGFPNRPDYWQADRFLKDSKSLLGQPLASKAEQFLKEEGVALFTVPMGAVQVGYRLSLRGLGRADYMLEFDLLVVSDTTRAPQSVGDRIYPLAGRTPGQLNLREAPIGLGLAEDPDEIEAP